MHGQVHASLGQGFFDLLGEHSFGTDLGEGDLLQAVAGGFDDFDFDRVALSAQQDGDVVGLPEGELRAAASDA